LKAVHVLVLLVVAGFVAFIVLAPSPPVKRAPVEGDVAPDFELLDLRGNAVRLSGFRGAVVLVNFWATWCTSCREEMPSLNALNASVSGTPAFSVLTVLYQDSPETAADYLEKNGYALPVLVDSKGSVAESYGLTGVPETFLIGRDGVLRKKIIGPFRFDSPEAIRLYEALIAG